MAKRCKIWSLSRRKIHLRLLALFACIVFGYVVVLDMMQQHVRDMSWFGSPSRRNTHTTNADGIDKAYGQTSFNLDYVEAYCQQRNVKAMKDNMTPKVGFLQSPNNQKSDQICIHPELDPCDPSITVYDTSVQKVKCPKEENWVYVENGVFRISNWARTKYGWITCEYAPIVRGKGDFSARHAEHIKPMLDGSPLVSDFFKVACISASGKRYHNIHAGVAYNESLHAISRKIPLPANALGYDVFMFGFDSTSRMSWIRNLPKTREFFLNTLGGIELEGYNIVGDGTVQALLPILTGNTERDLPSARQDNPRATEVDGFPWIWKFFKKAGYVTAWAEDMSYIGSFQMRLKGFREQPTDHSMRTYFMLAEPMYSKFEQWCVGSEPRHLRFLNWFRDLYYMYGNKPKFMFGFHAEYSHDCNNNLKKVDEDFANLLKHLHSLGYLNHTILVLMGDHGSRFSDIRNTPQGKLEERMPYFAFRFPSNFTKSHPRAVANFKLNTKRLTTPFDIHETFHDILSFQDRHVDHTKSRGISLFKEVPKNRTCEASGVEPHWCACLEWIEVDNSSTTEAVSSAVVDFINNLTVPVREKCASLQMSKVISLSRFSPNSHVLKYKKSSDRHGDIADLTDDMTLDYDYYQVSLVTEPGHGQFEVTVKHSTVTKKLWVSEQDISRTNEYGEAPSCIVKTHPNLRPYCYCLS